MTLNELKGLLARNPALRCEDPLVSRVPDPKPERNQKITLGRPVPGAKESVPRITVRFTGYRTRPSDPDNFAGSCKDLLDGLRYAGIIPGDEPWKIIFETTQVKVRSRREERTEIEVIQGVGG